MYQTSLSYHLRASDDKKKILEMFFKDWADRICDNKVRYSSVTISEDFYFSGPGPRTVITETIKVEFDNEEDAVAMKLKGVPPDLQQYLSLI